MIWGTIVFDKPAVLKKYRSANRWFFMRIFFDVVSSKLIGSEGPRVSSNILWCFNSFCCQMLPDLIPSPKPQRKGMIPIMLMRWWSLEGAFQISPKQISNLNWAVAKTSVLFLYTNICLPQTLPPYFRGHSFHNSLPQRFHELSFQIRNVARNAFGFRDASANLGFNTPSAKACAELPRCGCGFSLPRGHLSLSPR